MGKHHRPHTGDDEALRLLQLEGPFIVTGQKVHRHPLPLQLPQRTHDRVVLHLGGQHPIPRSEQPFEQEIEGIGGPRRKADAARARAAHQGVEPLPHLQHPAGGIIGLGIPSPGDVAAHALDIIRHGPSHTGRLGKGGGGVVQIDA